MKKNKLFILSSILIIISLFATAVTCNLCGTPIEITVPEEEKTEEKPEIEQQTTITTQESQNTEDAQSTEAPVEGNNPPVIEEIEVAGVDVEFATSEGMFDELPAVPGITILDVIFTIEAYDEDGDELQYRAYDSRGTNFDVTKIDNNNAELHWESPNEAGAYTLTMEVSDSREGTDSYLVDMNFVENNPPEIIGEIIIEKLPDVDYPPGDAYISGEIPYRIRVETVDPDGDPLTYQWYGGVFTDETINPTTLITPPTPGTYMIGVYVWDHRSEGAHTQIPVTYE
ncbi:MAG: PKD domain-containing protein [Actinobacteria bacterium]|nr:PKD domain-containing protein [Actinomycetota bacterium]